MHMADALVSPAVAAAAGVISVGLIGTGTVMVKRSNRSDLIPLMGVMGAFVFAAQMINFTIPGTGSSGHIIGGVLLGALLGPWAAFITLCSVLIIQCLIFADGGLMALGCNILNMGAMTCLVAFPLIYRPLAGRTVSKWRIWIAAITACVIGLELGALLVTAETELSEITALPFRTFLGLMGGIHLAIGACEGIATAVILTFIAAYQPVLLYGYTRKRDYYAVSRATGTSGINTPARTRKLLLWTAVVALLLALSFSWLASSNPDGLEWSIGRITGATEIVEAAVPPTALMPGYDSTFAGIVGGVIVVVMIWAISAIIFRKRKNNR